MDKPCIIQADFSTFRPVSGRKVLQLTFEVPIEQTRDVLEKLGIPTPGENRWCAIALLDLSKPSAAPEAQAAHPKDRRPFSTLPLSQQAAIRCQDRDFRKYLAQKDGPSDFLMLDTEMAADEVRAVCKVDSRSKIIEGDKSGDYWLNLEANYQHWLTDQRYAGSKR